MARSAVNSKKDSPIKKKKSPGRPKKVQTIEQESETSADEVEEQVKVQVKEEEEEVKVEKEEEEEEEEEEEVKVKEEEDQEATPIIFAKNIKNIKNTKNTKNVKNIKNAKPFKQEHKWADDTEPTPTTTTLNANNNKNEVFPHQQEFEINLDEVPELEKQKVYAVSTVNLIKILITRGTKSDPPNPIVSIGAEKILKQLNRVPFRPHGQPQQEDHQFQGRGGHHGGHRGGHRGGNRGGYGGRPQRQYNDTTSMGSQDNDDNDFNNIPQTSNHQHQRQHRRPFHNKLQGAAPNNGFKGANRYNYNNNNNNNVQHE